MHQTSSVLLGLLALISMSTHVRCSPTPVPQPQGTDSRLPYNPGGPMIPAITRPDLAPTPAALLGPDNSCTWTISETDYPCNKWNKILTVYPETVTGERQVDCHGCSNVKVDQQLWYCPNMPITATETVQTPSTYWTTACATSTVLGRAPAPVPTAQPVPDVERRIPQGNLMDQNPAACPTTYVVQPPQLAGSTATRYQQTVTQTVKLPCGGCPLVISTALAGYGPGVHFTTTITAPVSTTTAYACQ